MYVPPSVVPTIDGSYLEGGGQILRLAITYSALLGIPVHIFNIRANRPRPGLSQQHLHGLKLVANLCNGRLSGDFIGSTEVRLWPRELKGGNFKVHLTTAGSIALMLQCAVPVALFSEEDVTFSLGGGTDCAFAPPIDYTKNVLGHYLEKFGVHVQMEIKQRGLFPEGGGKVDVKVKKIDRVLKNVVMRDAGKCSEVAVNVIYTGKESEMVADCILNASEEALAELKSTGVNIKTKKYKESKILPHCADTALLDITYETDTGVKCSTSRIFNTAQNKKRKHNSRSESFVDKCRKFEQTSKEAAEEILNYLKTSTCCDEHMQDQLIVYMALATGTSRMVVNKLTDHTKTAQYVTNTMTKAQVNITPLEDGVGHVIQCRGLGFQHMNRITHEHRLSLWQQ